MRVKRGPIAYRPPVELPPCRQCGVALNPETVELTCEGAFCRVCGARDPVGGMLGRPGPQAGSSAAGPIRRCHVLEAAGSTSVVVGKRRVARLDHLWSPPDDRSEDRRWRVVGVVAIRAAQRDSGDAMTETSREHYAASQDRLQQERSGRKSEKPADSPVAPDSAPVAPDATQNTREPESGSGL